MSSKHNNTRETESHKRKRLTQACELCRRKKVKSKFLLIPQQANNVIRPIRSNAMVENLRVETVIGSITPVLTAPLLKSVVHVKAI